MVGINALTRQSARMTPLKPANEAEEKIHKQAILRHHGRIEKKNFSLLQKPPNQEETGIIHQLYLDTLDPSRHSFKYRVKSNNDWWMSDTALKGFASCYPENRNMYGKIFGGFLMRSAYELAWAESWSFSQCRPSCVAVDDIIFRKPVEIGSLLYLSQIIGITEENLIQTQVLAEVSDVTDPRKREICNIFHFTFRVQTQRALPKVIPQGYGESMLHLDSRRRLLAAKHRLSQHEDVPIK